MAHGQNRSEKRQSAGCSGTVSPGLSGLRGRTRKRKKKTSGRR